MHHQDHSGDSPGTGSRKAAYHYRRGSSGASASAASLDDNSTQAGSSSPGLHQQAQSQGPGAQVKKKSGFQITSVTSAQINVSGNNSLADDTESYDDMDESHTEDLSSSEMLDVSVPRATDTGLPERSSSDETLNSLHGMDTPGLVSPNEPLHPHSLHQGPQKHSSMVNGAVHQPYYPHQHSLPHLHHSESAGGGEASTPALPSMPLASSSPLSKAGSSQAQMDSLKLTAGPSQPLTQVLGVKAPPYCSDAHQPGSVNLSTVAAAAAPPPGPSGFDNTGVSGATASIGGGTGPSAPAAPVTQSQQTQTATGSRFRVVKLDTNSEPFRKGRWTCTEYYEKEIPSATASEAHKGAEAAAETEAGNSGMSPGPPAVQPPHTLQPYQLPSQDFSSPQAMQNPPQALVQPTPLTFISPQEAVGVSGMQKPAASVSLPVAAPQVMAPAGGSQPQQLPYALDHHHAPAQGGYPTPQLGGAVGVRQPDFIQPTAPFQTQVPPPLQHSTTAITPGSGVTAQPPVGITQQLPHQGQGAPPPQTQAHPASTQGTPYMPLSALQADLQPLLTPGTTLTQHPLGGSSPKTSHLEDAQKLLFQHQGLLGLPRLGMAAGGEGGTEAGSATGHLAHMGMSAEASAFMAAAAAGLRTQHAEGEDESSSGASVVAIDNKIEQAMDLVKSHLMYAVREEVEVLKEQIKELIERNTQLEQENNLLKTLASPEQMAQFQAQVQTGSSPTGAGQPPAPGSAGTQVLPSSQNSGPSA